MLDRTPLDNRVAKLAETVRKLQAQQVAYAAEMAALERAGISDASAYWREKKYLYLNHPTRDGDRQREYVGSDPDKIAEAIAKIERYKRWFASKKNLELVTTRLQTLSLTLDDLDRWMQRGKNGKF